MQRKAKVVKMALGAIRDNSAFAISVQEKDIDTCLRTIKQYGVVSPPIIRSCNGDNLLISGQCELTALRRQGLKSSEVVAIEITDDIDANKLTLLLSSLRKANYPLTEGIILKELLDNGEVSQTQLAMLTGKSVSWISRRLNLVCKLDKSVLQMVSTGQVCARTAQEIAKLPSQIQHRFAVKVVDCRVSKSMVEKLVSTYNCPDISNSFKEQILKEPKDAYTRISSKIEQLCKNSKKSSIPNPQLRFSSGLRLLIGLLEELEDLAWHMNLTETTGIVSMLEIVYCSMVKFMDVLKVCIGQAGMETFAPGQHEMLGGNKIANQYGTIPTNQTTIPG